MKLNSSSLMGKTAMFLGIAFTAISMHMTAVGSFEVHHCPTVEQMRPCTCKNNSFFSPGLYLRCKNNLNVDQVRGSLAIAADTSQYISFISLENIWLPNVPSNLLSGQRVNTVYIRYCHAHSVDKDAFVAVAAQLDWLYIRDNALRRVPSEALEVLSKLRYLILDNNEIDMLHAEAFKGLHSLLDLYVRGNKIKFIDNSAFVGIGRRFRKLILPYNMLTVVPYQAFRNLSALKFLDLFDNRIVDLVPEEVDDLGLESLLALDLKNNRIRYVPPGAFKPLNALATLDLSGNAIEAIHPLAFLGIEDALEVLKLGYNRLEEVPSAALRNMSVLTTLELNDNKICEIRKDDFQPYGRQMEIIRLQNNSVKYIDTAAFLGLNSVEKIYLQSNQLTTAPRETYAPIKDAISRREDALPFFIPRDFQISDNPLHCDCNLTWLRDWMVEEGSELVTIANQTKCATPVEHAGTLLGEISSDRLVCEKSISEEPFCGYETSAHHRITVEALLILLDISFSYLATRVLS